MRTYLALYLKTITMIFVIYLMIMIFLSISDFQELAWFDTVMTALLFSAIFSLMLVIWHLNKLKEIGVDVNNTDVGHAIYSDTIALKIDQEELQKRLKECTEYKVGKKLLNYDTVHLRSDSSWYSWGEEIFVTNIEGKADRIEYRIESRPRFFMNVLDFGKNAYNVIRIKDFLHNSVD